MEPTGCTTLKQELPRRLGCELIELYGLTEGLITTLDPEDFSRKLDSVGRPLPGQQLKRIGEDDGDVAPGMVGEIVGLGRLTMRGYHRRPEATRDATWTDQQGRHWPRSGDLGRLDEAGFLYLVERKKDMILSGGQNIYPADLEAVLLQHSAVAEAAVIGIPSKRWGEEPLALVVAVSAAGAASPSAEALLDRANARLGRPQRIARLRFVESLPRNPNGKILKQELR